MALTSHVLEVPDDSGFLGLVDPDAYVTFVNEDWTLDQLFEHFRSEMSKQTLLLWATGIENFWRVEITTDATSPRPPGFRHVSGPIRVTAGRLLLVNYETLTMAAQFADVALPEPHLADLLVDVPSGDHSCQIIQAIDPDADDDIDDTTHFILTLTTGQAHAPWSSPAWFHQDW